MLGMDAMISVLGGVGIVRFSMKAYVGTCNLSMNQMLDFIHKVRNLPVSKAAFLTVDFL